MEPIKRYTPRIRTNEFGLRWVEFIEESEGDMAFYADHEAKVSELEERLTTLKQQRIKYGPICLVCGAAEPCHLKDDPHSPCTFDPAPRELWDRCKEQKQRISELEERLVDYDAAASECEGQSVLTTLHALKQYGMQLEREKADLEVKLRQVEQERDQVRARAWEEARGLLLAQQCHEPFYGSAIYKQVVVDFARWIDKLVDMCEERAKQLRKEEHGTTR